MAVDDADVKPPVSLLPPTESSALDDESPAPKRRPPELSSNLPDLVTNLPDVNGSISSTSAPLPDMPKYILNNYTRLYQMDQRPDCSEDLCVLVHTNKLCVIVLAPSHPVVALKKECLSVSFTDCDGSDRTQSHGQGARKKGAQFIEHGSVICRVECADRSSYVVSSGIRGKLLEVNTNLSARPSLLSSKPFSTGYLAIIMPNAMEMDIIRASLHDEDMFRQLRKI
ncbi:protein Abitram-like [Paramacrobiotus metropolitanus]|uniref:protein Abitram-like n=1 Tax=Paramacrobiotus metropolitanus TaxID=2943436 RepID=UPI00244589D3|nr:protein Abitram-like [Paramacrobiotus metropolitanus]